MLEMSIFLLSSQRFLHLEGQVSTTEPHSICPSVTTWNMDKFKILYCGKKRSHDKS